MSFTVTERPDVFRASFRTSDEAPSGRSESEIVCLVRLVPTGIEILYAYHLIRSRHGLMGAMENEDRRKLELTSSLVATIEHGVKEQFWSAFQLQVRNMPSPSEGGLVKLLAEDEKAARAK